MTTRLSLLLALIVALAAPALAQGTGGDIELTTGVNGAMTDTANKPIAGGDVLTFNIASPGGSLVGQTAALAGDLIPDGFPICIDLGTGATCDLNLGSGLFLILFPSGTIFDPTVTPTGLEASFVVPNDLAFFFTPDDETLRLQSAITDPSAALGAEISNFVDHFTNKFTIDGPTGDDSFVAVELGQGFPFYGTVHTQVFVGSNGYATFVAGDSDFSPTEGELLDQEPRIAGLWDDLSPNQGGDISICYERAPNGALIQLAIDFNSVVAFGTSGAGLNSFSMILDMSGDIDLAWSSTGVASGISIVGVSPGGMLSAANDIGGYETLGGPIVGGTDQALYHIYDGSCGNDLDVLPGGTATFAYDAMNSAYTVSAGGTFTTLPLVVNGFSPSNGVDTGGDTVTVDGCGFDMGNSYTVEFGGVSVPGTVVDTATLTCVTPAGSGTVDVEVFENGGSVALFAGGFTYMAAGVFVTPGPDSDDGNVNVVFNNGPFSFYGVSYTECFVNSNGNVTFTGGDTDFGESDIDMNNEEPRIAVFWDDCRPPSGGMTITITETLTDIQFAYVDVPAFSTGMNTCIATIDRASSDISLAYGASSTSFNGVVSSRNCIAGISPGGGGTQLAVDLNAPVGTVGGAMDGLYQWLNDVDGPWDLDGVTVNFAWNGVGYTH